MFILLREYPVSWNQSPDLLASYPTFYEALEHAIREYVEEAIDTNELFDEKKLEVQARKCWDEHNYIQFQEYYWHIYDTDRPLCGT